MGVASSRQSNPPKAHASVQTETPITEPGNASEAPATVIVASTASIVSVVYRKWPLYALTCRIGYTSHKGNYRHWRGRK